MHLAQLCCILALEISSTLIKTDTGGRKVPNDSIILNFPIFHEDATLCSYVPKKNKAVILLSSMHTTGDISQNEAAKPEMILYYNNTKGAVDTLDKMLHEYTTKRKTRRWPLAFFFNILDIAALAAYIIFIENNPNLIKKSEGRRHFLTQLAEHLCVPTVEIRSLQPNVMGVHATRAAIELVLGRKVQPIVPITNSNTRGRSPIVGSCHICDAEGNKKRKTRTACFQCQKPVCPDHYATVCTNCL